MAVQSDDHSDRQKNMLAVSIKKTAIFTEFVAWCVSANTAKNATNIPLCEWMTEFGDRMSAKQCCASYDLF